MSNDFEIGQRVIIKENIWEPADDHSPAGYIAHRGDEVTIKNIRTNPALLNSPWIYVAHDHITNGATFTVTAFEIEPKEEK